MKPGIRHIHVDRHALMANARIHGGKPVVPVFVVQLDGRRIHTKKLELTGPAEGVVGEEPLGDSSGPRVWLETKHPVETDEGLV